MRKAIRCGKISRPKGAAGAVLFHSFRAWMKHPPSKRKGRFPTKRNRPSLRPPDRGHAPARGVAAEHGAATPQHARRASSGVGIGRRADREGDTGPRVSASGGRKAVPKASHYMQIIPHTDRLDYVCAMTNNYAYVRTVEKLLDITVPERAEYIRTLRRGDATDRRALVLAGHAGPRHRGHDRVLLDLSGARSAPGYVRKAVRRAS